MKKKVLFIIVEFILFILVVISLYDGFSEISRINLTPLFTVLMLINIVIAAFFTKK